MKWEACLNCQLRAICIQGYFLAVMANVRRKRCGRMGAPSGMCSSRPRSAATFIVLIRPSISCPASMTGSVPGSGADHDPVVVRAERLGEACRMRNRLDHHPACLTATEGLELLASQGEMTPERFDAAAF